MGNDVHIEESYDGFAIIVNGQRFNFPQERSVVDLIEVFAILVGKNNVTFEEVC